MDGVDVIGWDRMESFIQEVGLTETYRNSTFTYEIKGQCRGYCDIQSWVND